jgi:hypothetical protein
LALLSQVVRSEFFAERNYVATPQALRAGFDCEESPKTKAVEESPLNCCIVPEMRKELIPMDYKFIADLLADSLPRWKEISDQHDQYRRDSGPAKPGPQLDSGVEEIAFQLQSEWLIEATRVKSLEVPLVLANDSGRVTGNSEVDRR